MNFIRVSTCASLLSIIAACGGAGGDNGLPVTDNPGIEAIAPLVGVWDLPDDWNGRSGDEAHLVIKTPDANGVAEAIIYDLDDAVPGNEQNCFLTDGGEGMVRQALNNDLFLDLPVYSSAVVVLKPNGELEISVFAEGATSDALPERVLTAQRLGLTENELTLC